MAFLRVVDGAVIDYGAARAAHYAYWKEPGLGGRVPIAAMLVPSFHHIENCISNTHRALQFCDRVRRLPATPPATPLVEGDAWRRLRPKANLVRQMRDAIQHTEQRLLNGELDAAAVVMEYDGRIVFAPHQITVADLAWTIEELRHIAAGVPGRLHRPAGPDS